MPPTFESSSSFDRAYGRLSGEQQQQFMRAVRELVDDLKAGVPIRRSLRVKRLQTTDNVWELTWAPDGRATWCYGSEKVPGQAHVVWLRVGSHEIF